MSRARPATTPSTSRPTGPVKMTGNPATTVKLAAKQRTSMALALDAGGAGTANLDVDIAGPNGLDAGAALRARRQGRRRRCWRAARSGTLAKGESLTLTSDMFSDLVPGTGSVSLSVEPVDRARCRDHPEGARPLSASAAPSRSPAARCRCSMSTISPPARIWRWTPRSTSASGMRSSGCWRARARTARSACGRPAATTPGSTPTSRTS